MRSTTFALLSLAALALPACVDDPMIVDGPGRNAPAPLPRLANAGELAAPRQLGDASVSLDHLRKRLAVTPGALAGLEVGPAFLTRRSPEARQATAFIYVSNPGATLRCYVHADLLDYRDASGGALHTTPSAYLLGSIGEKAGFATDTCLAPGESGYIVDVTDTPYDAVSALTFRLEVGAEDHATPLTAVLPGAVAAPASGLEVAVENQGPGPATIDAIGTLYLAFDELGQPLDLGYLAPCESRSSRRLEAGESLDLCSRPHAYAGSTHAVQVRVAFSDAESTSILTNPATKRAR